MNFVPSDRRMCVLNVGGAAVATERPWFGLLYVAATAAVAKGMVAAPILVLFAGSVLDLI
jgi:hypothetical protein